MKTIGSPRHAITGRSWARILAAGGATVGPAAAMAASAPGASAATWYTTPAITVAGGNTVIAVQNWHPESLPGSDITSSAITTYTGNRDGVHVVNESLFGTLSVDSAENGSSTWQWQAAHGAGGAGAAPAATMNNGSLNIAVFASSGDLVFYWQDGSGTFDQELVSPASLN